MRTEIHVIGPIDTTHKGPEALSPYGKKQLIHLQQGSLDGACGPYCLLMALMVCGVVSRKAITSLEPLDKKEGLGKLFLSLESSSAFFREGTDLKELKQLIIKTYGNQIQARVCRKKGSKTIDFIERHLVKNHPVIVGLNFKKGGHWVLAVGIEYQYDSHKGCRKLCRILVLDPEDSSPTYCAWNSVVDARPSGRRKYPYEWWTSEDLRVQFDGALAIYE